MTRDTVLVGGPFAGLVVFASFEAPAIIMFEDPRPPTLFDERAELSEHPLPRAAWNEQRRWYEPAAWERG